MELREDKIVKVLNEMSISNFCYRFTKLPNSFYSELNDQEKAEVIKRFKGR